MKKIRAFPFIAGFSFIVGVVIMVLKAIGTIETNSFLYLKGSAICWSCFILAAAFTLAESFIFSWTRNHRLSVMVRKLLTIGTFFMSLGMLLLTFGTVFLVPFLMQIFGRESVEISFCFGLTLWSMIGGSLLWFVSMFIFPLLEKKQHQ